MQEMVIRSLKSTIGDAGKRKLQIYQNNDNLHEMAKEFSAYRSKIIEEVKAGIHAPHVTEADIVY